MPRAAFAPLAAIAALLCSTAHADDPQWRIGAGPGVLILPKYPGAADSEVFPIADIDLAYGRLFVNWRHGVGAYFLNTGQRQAGADAREGWRRHCRRQRRMAISAV